MDEENYVPHLNFSGLYNNLNDVLSDLPLPGNHNETSLLGLNNIIDGEHTRDKINKLLGSTELNKQDGHIRNRLLGQSISSALRSTSLDEFNPLISKYYPTNLNTVKFVPLEDCSPLFKEILFLDPGCFNDVPLSENHIKQIKEKRNINEDLEPLQDEVYLKNERYIEGLGERVKKRKRRPTYPNHSNSINNYDQSDDDNTENHLDVLLSKKFNTSITKEAMGIKTFTSSTKLKVKEIKIRNTNNLQTIENESENESLIYGEDDELESDGDSEIENNFPNKGLVNNHDESDKDDDTSDDSYDGTKDNLYIPKSNKNKCKKIKSKRNKRIKLNQSQNRRLKKSYFESVKKISVSKRASRKLRIKSDDDEEEISSLGSKNLKDFKSEYVEVDEIESVDCQDLSMEEKSSSNDVSEMEDYDGINQQKGMKKKNTVSKFKDALSKDEIMETPVFVKFDNLLDRIIDHSEESDLSSLFMKRKDALDEDMDIPLDSLVPKSIHSTLAAEAAKIKALDYTTVFNTEKILKTFTIFLWNIRDGIKVIPLLPQGNEHDSENKLWEEISWERIFRSADCSLAALNLLTSSRISKKLFLEDLIEIIIQFTKYHLINTIYPEYDPIYKINKTKEFYVKSKRYKSHQVESKHTLMLYSKLNDILNMLGELVEVQTLTDSSIILISSLGTQPFFVENVNDLQLNALKLITSVFSKYDKHRQLILEDILSSLARLPISKRNLRTYKIGDDENIQMVSALVLQLIHCIVDFPLPHSKDNTTSKEIKDNIPDQEILTFNSFDNAAKTAHTFLAVFLKKCSVRSCAEEDFRTLFDHFIEDLLLTVNKAEWPASEMLLTILGRILVQNFSDRKVEISLRLTSLEYLGKITSRLRRDSLTTDSDMKTLKEILEQIRISNEEEYDINYQDEPETLKLQKMLLNYLQENSVNDPFIRFARKFIIIQWYCDIVLKANKNSNADVTNSKDGDNTNTDIEFSRSTRKLSDSKIESVASIESVSTESELNGDNYKPKCKSSKKHTKEGNQNLDVNQHLTVQSSHDNSLRKSSKKKLSNSIDEDSPEFLEYHKKFLISFIHPSLYHYHRSNYSLARPPTNNTLFELNTLKALDYNGDKKITEMSESKALIDSNTTQIGMSTKEGTTTLIQENNKINIDLINSFNINSNFNTNHNLVSTPQSSLYSSFKDSKVHIDSQQASIITKYLASRRVFCRNYEIYLIQIMKVVHESAIAIRTKAMKCLANIIEADPGILAQPSIQSTIHLRLMDQSPSVREAAIELIGKCILAKSELIPQYFNMIAERILDTGVSVRKRVIRILRDICNDFPEYQNITSTCCKLVRRINDEEGIKKLVIEVFQTMWFNPEFSRIVIDKKLANITETVNYFMEHGPELIENLLENILTNSEDPNCANACKAGFKIVDTLIDKIMRIDENKDDTNQNRTHKLVPCLSTLYLFTKIDPEFTVKHCDTLQPYLVHKCNSQGDCMIIHYVAKIFKLTVPKMGHPNPIFLSHLEESLMKLIVTQGVLVLESCVACLSDIIKNVTHNYVLITDCFFRFLCILFKMALETYEHENSSLLLSKKPFVLRSLYTVGLLCMHFNFDDDYLKLNKKVFQEKLHIWENQYFASTKTNIDSINIDQDISTKKIPFLNTSNQIPVSECVYEIFYHFITSKDEEIRHKALTGLGFFCINNPRYLSHTKTKELYQLFLTDTSIPVNLKYQVLKNIFAYLQEEENKATSANKDYDKTKKEDDFKEICEISTSLSSAIVQIYLKDLLDRCLDVQPNVRLAASNVIATIIKQGLIYPVQCIPHLITMATDSNSVIRNKAHTILTDLDIKYPGFISMKALAGARKSYDFHKTLHLYELDRQASSHAATVKSEACTSNTTTTADTGKKVRSRKTRHAPLNPNFLEDNHHHQSHNFGDCNSNIIKSKLKYSHVLRGFIFYSSTTCSQAVNLTSTAAYTNVQCGSYAGINCPSPIAPTGYNTQSVPGMLITSSSSSNLPPHLQQPQHPIATIGFLYTLLRNSKSQRRFFIDSLLKLFDEQSRVPLEELLYVADNMAYFPYVNQDEPLFLLHQMEIMTSVTGSNLLQAFCECLGRDSTASSNKSSTKNINSIIEEYEDEDNIDKLLANVSDHPVSLYECCVASQGYFLLLYLRQFLKNLFSLTDNKLANYSPMDTSKVFDKPISGSIRKPSDIFTPQSTLEYLETCYLSSLPADYQDQNINTNTLNRKMPDPKMHSYSTQEKLNLIRQYLEFKEMMLKLDPNEEDDDDVKAIKASREMKAQQKLNTFKNSQQKNKNDNEALYTVEQINSNEAPDAIPKVHIRLNKNINSPSAHLRNLMSPSLPSQNYNASLMQSPCKPTSSSHHYNLFVQGSPPVQSHYKTNKSSSSFNSSNNNMSSRSLLQLSASLNTHNNSVVNVDNENLVSLVVAPTANNIIDLRYNNTQFASNSLLTLHKGPAKVQPIILGNKYHRPPSNISNNYNATVTLTQNMINLSSTPSFHPYNINNLISSTASAPLSPYPSNPFTPSPLFQQALNNDKNNNNSFPTVSNLNALINNSNQQLSIPAPINNLSSWKQKMAIDPKECAIPLIPIIKKQLVKPFKYPNSTNNIGAIQPDNNNNNNNPTNLVLQNAPVTVAPNSFSYNLYESFYNNTTGEKNNT